MSGQNLRNSKTLDKNVKPDQVRVIVDCRDSSKDYFISRAEARDLYDRGLLAWDVTNQTYCEPTD